MNSVLQAGWTELVKSMRTLLILGRISHMPTVWSNCLAGWLLSGGGTPGNFIILSLGATCLYLGGMFLNDACDAQSDTVNRRERPIPSGAIEAQTVWLLSLGWFAIGSLFLVSIGKSTSILTVLLLGCIVLYNMVHKIIAFSPVLMAACRFLLYLVAGSAASDGLGGLTIWSGFALAAYVIGVSYLARKQSTPAVLRYWPCCLMAIPILLAWIVNDQGYKLAAFFFSFILAAWILWCLRYTFWTSHRNIPLTVSGLHAGMVLVDLLAVAGGSLFGLVFLMWFAATLIFQRVVPAT